MVYYISFARRIQACKWGARPCARSTLRPCTLCYSILKILCQLLQTTPDTVTNTAWVYALRCGDLTHTHTQIIPGIDPLGLFLRQRHHCGVELLPQLLFLQKHFRCLGLHQDRIFNAVVAVQGVVRLIAIHPPVISSFRTLSGSDRLQHIFCYFYKVIIFINIGI